MSTDDRPDLNRLRNLVYLFFGLPALALLIALAVIKEKPQKTASPPTPVSREEMQQQVARRFGAGELTPQDRQDDLVVTILQIARRQVIHRDENGPAKARQESLVEFSFLVEVGGTDPVAAIELQALQPAAADGRALGTEPVTRQLVPLADYSPPAGVPQPQVSVPTRAFVLTCVCRTEGAISSVDLTLGYSDRARQFHFSGLRP